VSFDSGGGSASVPFTMGAGCAWHAYETGNWVNPTAWQGTGSAALNLTVGPNPGIPRTATYVIGGTGLQVMQKGAVAPVFDDVPASHPYFDYIYLMKHGGVTSGCTAASYCPDATTTRSQMAVFIIRSLVGDSFSYSATPYFTDVPPAHPHFKYVQKMKDYGITSGCSATQYCPDAPVTRGQMAVFIVRARLSIGAGVAFPHPEAAMFSDVPPSHPYFAFIQEMREQGITSGCSATQYCPDDPTTRGQMAVFLVRGLLTY